MEILLIIHGFILAAIIVVIYEIKLKKPKNNVHFYVARDKDGFLALWLGKPFRAENKWTSNLEEPLLLTDMYKFYCYGLNRKDYKDLKWEDEPVEVFLNLEN